MRHILIYYSICFWWIWTWLICSISSCSFVYVAYWLGTNVLLSVVKGRHMLSILLHFNIFTLHSHGTWWSPIFIQTVVWFLTHASFFHFCVWVLMHKVNPIMCMRLHNTWTVSTATGSSFARVNVAIRQFTDASLLTSLLSRFLLFSATISWRILLRPLWQNYVCIPILVLYFWSSLLWINFLHVFVDHALNFYRCFLTFFVIFNNSIF